MDLTKIDLSKPAFGKDAQTLNDLQAVPPEDSVETKEEVEKEEVQAEASVEEQKVPYSRFKKFHEASIESAKEAEHWKAEAERLRSERPEVRAEESGEIPSYWQELYGDSDASKRAWEVQQQQLEDFKRESREEALRAVREERSDEAKRVDDNVATIDNNLEALSAFVGRDLSDKEETAVLDIVDNFTPKDEEGNYLGAVLPFEKAWEIYELKTQASLAPKRQARDSVANLTGSASQGESSISADRDKQFNPSWGALSEAIRRRL